MKDTYGREISYLRLSVTELCNLRCRYCMPADGVCKKEHNDMLTEEEIVMAVETAAELGVNKLRITGGEPLVKKNIVSICSRTAAVPGIREVCITTNGTRLPELARPLRDAGVGRLNISLDTLDEDKYRYITRIGSLDDALRGIEAALDTGFDKIKLNAVLIGGFNDDEIAPLADLTKRWPVDLRFIEDASVSSVRCRAISAASATASVSRRTASSSPACTARRNFPSRGSTATGCARPSARQCWPSPSGTASSPTAAGATPAAT